MNSDRRRVIKSLATVGAIALDAARPLLAAASLPADPFRLGVASGFPTDHSVVLWTRLAPDPVQPDGGLPPLDWELRYEVAADEQFRRVVTRGRALASAQFAQSVHVEAGGLAPDREYWYRFTAGDYRSPVGRSRTLPAARATVGAFRIAVANCQNYEHGHYAAYGYIAADAPDLVVHVGDYIYEGAPTANRVRQHTGGLCLTLEDYRRRYALYKSDPALQAAHAAAPWVCTWDDHEVGNDYAGDRNGARAEDPATFLLRRAAAYQAYYEHLPLPPSMAPRNGVMRIYSRCRIGTLATIHLLDQRQYRSPEACAPPDHPGGNRFGDECAERVDPSRTMLGAAQQSWLEQGLRDHPARWTVLAQGTNFSNLDELPGAPGRYWSDAWTGYPVARQKVIDALLSARSQNPVVLSGDQHAFTVGNVNAHPERLDSPLVAAEFVSSSISSDPIPQETLDAWRDNNPNFMLMDGRKRGYLTLRLSDARLQVDLIGMDDAARIDSGRQRLHSYVVEAGRLPIEPA